MRYLRINTKSAVMYIVHEWEFTRLRVMMEKGDFPNTVSLRSPCGEEHPIILDPREIEAMFISTPEDRERYRLWHEQLEKEEEGPWN